MLGALAAPPSAARGYVVGFSGGRDSTALLHALVRTSPTDTPVRAVHICHHLHPQASIWATHCADLCQVWGIAFERVDIHISDRKAGLEAAARSLRYDALASRLAQGDVLVTAHHARDQAETFLLQALRGAGLKGLAAMPALAPLGAGRHWRPWLNVDHADIVAYAHEHRLRWVDDPSNTDTAFDRNYLRHEVLPQLAARWPAFARTLSRSAAHAAQASEGLVEQARRDLSGVAIGDTLSCTTLSGLPDLRQRVVIREWLAALGRDRPDHRHVEQIRGLIDASLRASPCVHFGDTDVRRHADLLYAMAELAPVPEALCLRWDPRYPLELPSGLGELAMAQPDAGLTQLTVRLRRGGERIVDARGRRRLTEALREARVAPWVRERMPLIYIEDTLVEVAGFWSHPERQTLLGATAGPIHWSHTLTPMPTRVVED